MILHLSPLSGFRFSTAPGPSSERHRRRRRGAIRVQVDGNKRWKITDIDTDVLQERLSSWFSKAQNGLTEMVAPFVKAGTGRNPAVEHELEKMTVQEEIIISSELTVDRNTPNGYLSFAAVVSIEQFGRMNGLTGRKMQKIFETLAPDPIRNDARSLVEYCCFRYLSRDNSDFHPNIKVLTFQRLIFVTMLAWQQPYSQVGDPQNSLDHSFLQGRVIAEEAFVRIAPAVAGVADTSTAHYLFKALAGNEQGISLNLWTSYLTELLKVHQGRQLYNSGDNLSPNEQILCIGSSRKRPVLKWEENMGWPGNLTLTDNALYFEAIGLKGSSEKVMRLDLTQNGARVEKTKVGPFGSKIFDSAVAVTSGPRSETWFLEFVDFGGEMRRDVWYASIREVISAYNFIREFGPSDDDPSIDTVYGANKGKRRVLASVANSIARLQSLQTIRRLEEDPAKLVQFSYLQTAPYGDVVCQTLAVNFWGGPSVTKFRRISHQLTQWGRATEDPSGGNGHVFDIDGSVYLRKWMKSPSWSSSSSFSFWKDSAVKQGIVLAKNLVVGDMNLIERAALICKEKSRVVEKTQATIDAAMIKGIPSNIDLFKELMLPIVVIGNKFDKLRRWEQPRATITFLVFAYTLIFRNMLSYTFPIALMTLATAMLILKGLKEQGRLGRYFGKVMIRDQPPSNTIEKIIAVKEAMTSTESFLQNLNITLLKIRTIILAGQPEVTTEVALVLLGAAIVLLVVPFKYVAAAVIFDVFTRELEFRKEMAIKLMKFLQERWAAVHAAPVAVLPYESGDAATEENHTRELENADSQRKVTKGKNAKP